VKTIIIAIVWGSLCGAAISNQYESILVAFAGLVVILICRFRSRRSCR
jgi:hypothetical protein